MRPIKDKINNANHSMNPDRSNAANQMRSKATVKRLGMYKNGKERKNAQGKVIKEAIFQSNVKSGKMARIEPNRKWFGNTRVISTKDALKFNEYANTYDPYQVTLKKTIIPISIIPNIKKKPHLELKTYFRGHRKNPMNANIQSWEDLAKDTAERFKRYDKTKDEMETRSMDVTKSEASQSIFKAGTSGRVWGEVFKVIDSSDVILYVLDARDPMGTRSSYIEKYLREDKPDKKMIFVMNKIDLLPVGVIKEWRRILSAEYPTVAFYANIKHPSGKWSIINLLRQFVHLNKERHQISVGILGYPNVGKSSIINTLREEKVCNVAPIAGETKVWRYITLMKSVHLIDCPGVVNPVQATETELVLKGAVRVEKIDNPDLHIEAVLERVKPEVVKKLYNVSRDWKDFEDLLEILAYQRGRLLKGGVPDIQTVARQVLTDFQRGDLPYYTLPVGYKDDSVAVKVLDETKEWLKKNSKKDQVKYDEILKEMKDSTKNVERVEGEEYEDDCSPDDNNDDDVVPEDEVQNEEEAEKIDEHIANFDVLNKVAPEFASGMKKKPNKPKKKTNEEEKKLNCKEKRKLERDGKTKKAGSNFYGEVDVKRRRMKK